jgi:cysteinyl-tRNA synthetase
MAHPLSLYNTLSRKKERFEPLHPPKVGLYTCGPTVYNYAHIGNLRSYIFADTLRRVLKYNGYKVTQVMNITDVGHLTSDADEGEDKMEKGARREGKSVWEIAKHYTEAFKADLAKLNIEEPDIWCKATDHIKEQIEQVKTLEKKGYTYKIADGLYFDTSRLDDYGKLARLDTKSLKAGARIEMTAGKRNPADFALWKLSPKEGPKRQMEWPSPWGVGFPGWHVECSAMSSKYLGEQFDIHTGGIDHIPVHHTNEIAQAETAFGKKPWVKYWLHGEFLVMEQSKMAKSGESFITLQTVMDKGYQPLDYRYLCLTAHYRQQLKFSWDALDTAKQSRQRLLNIIEDLRTKKSLHPDTHTTKSINTYEDEFLDATNDDLNIPQALAVLWNALRDNKLQNAEKLGLITKFEKVLGLRLLDKVEAEVPAEILALAEKREAARNRKEFKESDRLRHEILAKGYQIDDTKDGYKIKKK